MKEKRIKLNADQLRKFEMDLQDGEYISESIAQMFSEMVSRLTEKRTRAWDVAAQMFGYENALAAHRDGYNLRINFVTGEVILCPINGIQPDGKIDNNELEALQRDAARYRYIRDELATLSDGYWKIVSLDWNGKTFEEALDADMEIEGEKQ